MRRAYVLPRGFSSAGIHAGIKKSGKPDAGLIVSDTSCTATAFFTKNRLKSAHIVYDKKVMDNPVRAVFCNAGSANCMTGEQGMEDLLAILVDLGNLLYVKPERILAAATGKIGKRIPVDTVLKHLPKLTASVTHTDKTFPKAIITTDLVQKFATAAFTAGGKKCTITAAGKGSGMISPNMATMLVFCMTDCAIDKKLMREAAYEAVRMSFNRITVDGDMSPNDTVMVLSNGAAGNKKIAKKGAEYNRFRDAIKSVFYAIADDMVMDGEGATKFIKLNISGAADKKMAERVARQIANSALVKTMFFGGSVNPGRIISAAGQTFEKFDTEKLTLKINGRLIASGGVMVHKNTAAVAKELKKRRLEVDLDLKAGRESCYLLTNDFSYDYVKINADYS
ncbi:MAG: bifunctional glutamate N-acetyltransferase/amino-acid acetyltransferase ArgJ [Spirochaetia bacterium]|nr:bifunctional glutamate N-acetyltransferase/amino-acid acetyltransferase ArgJ [Spirochaetia bacterium]